MCRPIIVAEQHGIIWYSIFGCELANRSHDHALFEASAIFNFPSISKIMICNHHTYCTNHQPNSFQRDRRCHGFTYCQYPSTLLSDVSHHSKLGVCVSYSNTPTACVCVIIQWYLSEKICIYSNFLPACLRAFHFWIKICKIIILTRNDNFDNACCSFVRRLTVDSDWSTFKLLSEIPMRHGALRL